jgi:hypothetical protein
VNINRVIWDPSNHLYAISQTLNKLYVLNVTSSGVTQVPRVAPPLFSLAAWPLNLANEPIICVIM